MLLNHHDEAYFGEALSSKEAMSESFFNRSNQTTPLFSCPASWAYETSLYLPWDLSHLHAQPHPFSKHSSSFRHVQIDQGCHSPLSFNAISFFCAWKTQTPALSPDQRLPPL